MNDYSEFLTAENLANEEVHWAVGMHNPKMAGLVTRVCSEHGLKTVIEAGCGSGWVPTHLPADLGYVGVDKNPLCLALASRKNPARTFLQGDLRDVQHAQQDVVCCLSVLKHFRPEEWKAVFVNVMRLGRHACFTMSIGPKIVNDGTDFPHTYITKEFLEECLAEAGKKIVYEERLTQDAHGWEFMFAAEPSATK